MIEDCREVADGGGLLENLKEGFGDDEGPPRASAQKGFGDVSQGEAGEDNDVGIRGYGGGGVFGFTDRIEAGVKGAAVPERGGRAASGGL